MAIASFEAKLLLTAIGVGKTHQISRQSNGNGRLSLELPCPASAPRSSSQPVPVELEEIPDRNGERISRTKDLIRSDATSVKASRSPNNGCRKSRIRSRTRSSTSSSTRSQMDNRVPVSCVRSAVILATDADSTAQLPSTSASSARNMDISRHFVSARTLPV